MAFSHPMDPRVTGASPARMFAAHRVAKAIVNILQSFFMDSGRQHGWCTPGRQIEGSGNQVQASRSLHGGKSLPFFCRDHFLVYLLVVNEAHRIMNEDGVAQAVWLARRIMMQFL